MNLEIKYIKGQELIAKTKGKQFCHQSQGGQVQDKSIRLQREEIPL